MTRRCRVFAEKADLEHIFRKYQETLDVYYVPTYSDIGAVEIHDITSIPDLGVNYHGRHIGNHPFRILLKTTNCAWQAYQYRIDKETVKTRYTTLTDDNTGVIDIDLGGVYRETALFPTEIGTINYDNEQAKKLYDTLKKVVRKESVCTVNGYYICRKAYENRNRYRFCTIDIQSPPDYDLKVE